MVIEYTRNVLNLSDASSTEFDLEQQCRSLPRLKNKQFVEGAGDLGGTMRLGLYTANPGSRFTGCSGL